MLFRVTYFRKYHARCPMFENTHADITTATTICLYSNQLPCCLFSFTCDLTLEESAQGMRQRRNVHITPYLSQRNLCDSLPSKRMLALVHTALFEEAGCTS